MTCMDHGQRGNRQGYGHSGKMKLHRKVFLATHGYLPPVVMHTCDNPRCINPEHLLAGDWASNNADRAAKGRSAKTRLDKRVLPDDAVAMIRARYTPKRCKVNGVCALAKEFAVDTNTIYRIIKGTTYV